MSKEIINRVANSPLITIDLANYAPKQKIINLDIKKFLFEEVVLKEKLFRDKLKRFDFSVYTNQTVAINCSSNAILPMWAFMLLASYLNDFTSEIYFGEKEDVFQKIFSNNIDAIDPAEFENKKVIIKGCGEIPLTETLYIGITKKLQNTVNSLMFGEACSSVPVFKKK